MKRRWLAYGSAFVVLLACGESKDEADAGSAARSGSDGHAGSGGAGVSTSGAGGTAAGLGATSGAGGNADAAGTGDGGTPGLAAGTGGHAAAGAPAGNSFGGATAGSTQTSGRAGATNGGSAGATNGGSAGSTGDLPLGQIAVLSLPGEAGLNGVYSVATFYAADYSSGCAEQPMGPCTVLTCSGASGGSRIDSGIITLASPEIGFETTLTPTDGAYGSRTKAGVYFSGQETIMASAPGNTAPGFQLQGEMPLVLLVSSPPLDPSATSGVIEVPLTADLVIEWSRGAPGVRAQIQGFTDTTSVLCSADSMLGEMTIPSAVLATLGAGTRLLPMTVAATSTIVDGVEFDLLAGMGMYTEDRQRIDFELQ